MSLLSSLLVFFFSLSPLIFNFLYVFDYDFVLRQTYPFLHVYIPSHSVSSTINLYFFAQIYCLWLECATCINPNTSYFLRPDTPGTIVPALSRPSRISFLFSRICPWTLFSATTNAYFIRTRVKWMQKECCTFLSPMKTRYK